MAQQDENPHGEPDKPGAGFRARPCPICGKPSVFEARPFCSKRCADVDLHRWLGGAYAIPAEEDDEAPPPRRPDD
ncbi:DNA gyrase inhibitor YacG [Methylocella sp.]|uniref:DNA gyrase inhibitor YacG n=1 Tax=Methylocella sp. TaxID=1978226 RepID=UPI003785163E